MSPFDEIIAPLTREEFLTRYWDQESLRIPGSHGKWTALLPWAGLNELLTHQRLPAPRLLLYKSGRALPADVYQEVPNGRLKIKPMLQQLESGATLIVNRVHEAIHDLRGLAADVARTLRATVHVNLYASWGYDNGFALHFDHQETFILQVHGRKKWQMWGPTRLHPLRPDVEEAARPQTSPLWEGLLEQGSVLYMPRGWWHVAFPIGEPSLHLTVTVVTPSGFDLLTWLAGELRSSVTVRHNLPLLAPAPRQAAYLEALRADVLAAITPDLLERYAAAHPPSDDSLGLRLPELLPAPADETTAGKTLCHSQR
jgi:ribosomal protein L16 Arg81 hydroxylase